MSACAYHHTSWRKKRADGEGTPPARCAPSKPTSTATRTTQYKVIGSCNETHPRSKRFVTTGYFFDEEGRPQAVMPDHCPAGADGSMCCVKGHSRRDRATGPCHELVVAKCATHEVFFTLYPMGFEPYGRSKVASERGRCEGWRATIFEAAAVAAAGDPAWPRDFDGGPGWWTQRRHIERAAGRMGLMSPIREAESIAETLGVGMTVHAQARGEYKVATGFRSRARAVLSVLDAMPTDGVLERVLGAGHLAGGPAPWIWTRHGYITPFH